MKTPLTGVPPSVTDPSLRRLLEQIIEQLRRDAGEQGVSSKRPTVEEMISAGIVNANKIK